ncbi:MAG: ABC transporter ATP-binding protein [Pseudomonadota bacterium]
MSSLPPPVLELSGVCKNFGQTSVLQGVDLSVRPGECLAVIGPNGAGKSTLFDIITGRQRADEGSVLLNGLPIGRKKTFEIQRLGLSRSFQVSQLFHRMSVLDNLRCAVLWSMGYRYSWLRRVSGLHDAQDRAAQLLAKLGLSGSANRLAGELSYAEQRAVEVGMTIAGNPSVVLLDEPTAGMSHSETLHFTALIRELTAGKTLLLVEHDMGVVFELADRITVLVQGEVMATGTPQEVRSYENVRAAYLGTGFSEEVAP